MTDTSCKVYSRLEIKREDGTTVKLRFQEPPPERIEEAFDMMTKYLLRDEVIHRSTGVYKNEEAIKEYQILINKLLEVIPPHTTICCVDDGTTIGGELAAVSILTYKKKTNLISEIVKAFDIKSKELQTLIKATEYLEEVEDLSQQYEYHHNGKGIVVHPDYRRMGIANEIVRLRSIVCQDNNIPMASAWMTAKGSQRAGEKNNWKTYVEVNPQELGAKSGLFFAADVLPFKLMYLTKD